MNYVIDASAIIAVIANEPEKDKLVKSTKGVDLLAPTSIPWEIGNAFSAMIKRERITLDQAKKALAIYRKIPIRFVEVELEDSLEMVNNHGIYAYDAYLIRCALKHKSILLTLDKKLADVAHKIGVEVLEIDK